VQPSNEKCRGEAALKQDHDELRAELAKATMEFGELGEVAKQVAKLCLPHFEIEEQVVFPLFSIVGDVTDGNVLAGIDAIHDLVNRFNEQREDLGKQHHAMIRAIESLWQIACEEGNEAVISLVHDLKSHEAMEEEVLYPAVLLIIKYARNGIAGRPSVPH
jgi:hypothetical protein